MNRIIHWLLIGGIALLMLVLTAAAIELIIAILCHLGAVGVSILGLFMIAIALLLLAGTTVAVWYCIDLIRELL